MVIPPTPSHEKNLASPEIVFLDLFKPLPYPVDKTARE